MAKNAAAGRTPSSLPMPTPPSAIASLNANALNDTELNVKS